MRLEFVGGESGNTGSPRVYRTDRDTLVIQGYIVDDPDALADANTPAMRPWSKSRTACSSTFPATQRKRNRR